MMKWIARTTGAWVLWLAACSTFAQSTGPDLQRALGLDAALARTLADNATLVAADLQIDVARGYARQANVAPNPQLTIAVEDIGGSGRYEAFDGAESTVSLAWMFERGARARRTEAARARVGLSAVEAEMLRVEMAAETARRFLDVLEIQGRAELATNSVELAERMVEAVDHRVRAGRTPQADLSRARARLARANMEASDLTHAARAARVRLAAQWGSTTPDFERVTGDPFDLPAPVSLARLLPRLERNPERLVQLRRARLDEANVRLAEARSRPPWEARFGVRRIEATDDHALVAGVTVPLAFRDRNQGNIAAARAAAERSATESAVVDVRSEAALSVHHDALQRSRARALALADEVLPPLEAALAQTRAAYELGRYGLQEWTAVQAEVLDARLARLAASIRARRHVIEIERLTGARIPESETH